VFLVFLVVHLGNTFFGSRINVFCPVKRKSRFKTRQVFSIVVGIGQTEFLQRFLKPDPKGWFASKPTDCRQAQMQTEEYIKSGGEPTAHRRSRSAN